MCRLGRECVTDDMNGAVRSGRRAASLLAEA
jgi:hypothetical protein